jgi:Rieske Fe-S protein
MTQDKLESGDVAGPDVEVTTPTTSRRAVLVGVGAAAVAVLGGCATYDQTAPTGGGAGNDAAAGAGAGNNAAGAGDGVTPTVKATSKATATADPGAGGGGGGAPAANALAQTGDIPVGGGAVFEQQKLVVTQPKAGTFKAFSAVCTHAGCVVGDVSGGTINCPCHGSQFKVADGSVAAGPAGRALKEVAITVKGTDIIRA